MNILFMRMLGNDLPALHGKDQTYNNLKFTLEHEPEFKDVTKGFILNRIIDTGQAEKIKTLLKDHNVAVWEIPFLKKDYDKLPAIDVLELKHLLRICNNQGIHLNELLDMIKQKTHLHNLYTVNNNGCRNKCIEIGIDGGYDWILPFDSNSFFTQPDFEELYRALTYYMTQDVVYNVVPQLRLSESNLSNKCLLNNNIQTQLHEREPQICFRKDAPLMFNKTIPYGSSPKAELLRALNVPGPWQEWKPYELYGIECRSACHVKIGKNSKVYRLNSFCGQNDIKNNNTLRVYGLINLLCRVEDEEFSKKSKWF